MTKAPLAERPTRLVPRSTSVKATAAVDVHGALQLVAAADPPGVAAPTERVLNFDLMAAKKKSGKIPTPSIVMAASDGELAVVKAELKKGVNVNAVDRGGGTALHQAACNHHILVVKALLSAGADARIADTGGRTALHFAARELQPQIVNLLLDGGADVDARDQDGNTPLSEAVFATQDDPTTIQLLIAAGADMKQKNKHGVSPLGLAQDVDHPSLEKWLRFAPGPREAKAGRGARKQRERGQAAPSKRVRAQ